MTPRFTNRFGLQAVEPGDNPWVNGGKFFAADRDLIDLLLWLALAGHHHTGASGTAEPPENPLAATVEQAGGFIPASTRLWYTYTLASDATGLESGMGPVVQVDTPEKIAAPDRPTLAYGSGAGSLLPGTYYYRLSGYTGVNTSESTADLVQGVTIPLGSTTNRVIITLPDLPSGATGFNIYRRGPGENAFYYLDSVDLDVATPPTEYVDDGTVDEDCNRTHPTQNTSFGANSIVLDLPGDLTPVPDGYHWRLYRTSTEDDWSASLLSDVVEETFEGSGIYTTTYTDQGEATSAGAPPQTTFDYGSPSKILLTDGAEVQGILPKEFVESVGGGLLATVTVAAADSTAEDQAKADFVCTGTNDEVTFQAIIDAMGSTFPSRVLVIECAPGSYSFGAKVDVDTGSIYAQVWLVGRLVGVTYHDFPHASFYKDAAGNFPLFEVATSRKFLVRGIDFETNQNESIASGLLTIQAGSTLRMAQSSILNYSNGTGPAIKVVNNSNVWIEIDDCDIETDGDNCIAADVSGSINFVARHTYFYSDTGYALSFPTSTAGGDILLDDCWTDAYAGISVDGPGSGTLPDVRILNSRLEPGTGDAINITDARKVEIQGGYITAGDNGIKLNNVSEGVVHGVNVHTAGRHGIWVLDSDKVVIEGNLIQDVGTDTDNTYSGIILDGDTNDCLIAGNKITTDGAGNLPLYGIRVDDATCDNNTIAGTNAVRGSSKTNGNEISDAGTGTAGYEVLLVALGDDTTAITSTGNPKVTMRMPYPFCLTKVRASLTTASSGAAPAFDVNDGGASVFSTTLTIDASEKTSVTAATPAVISDHYLADDAEVTFDIDTAGTGATGAKIALMGWRL